MRFALPLQLITLFCGLASAADIPSTSWHWMNPLPQGNTLNAVWAEGTGSIVAVGVKGTILRFDGQSWTLDETNTTLDLYDIWGTDTEHLVAVGEYGLVLFYENGVWVEHRPIGSRLRAVWGSSMSNVFVAGDNGKIVHFDGAGWDTTTVPGLVSIVDIWGASSSDVYALTYHGSVLHFNGLEWTASQPFGSGSGWRAISGRNQFDVFVVGNAKAARKTIRGWTELTGVPPDHLRDVVVTQSRVFTSGDSGAVHVLEDGTWTSQVVTDSANPVFGLWRATEDSLIAVGTYGIISVFDGDTWEEQSKGPRSSKALGSVWGPSVRQLYAVGGAASSYGPVLLRFDGISWQEESVPTDRPLQAIWGSAPDNIYAVGDTATVIHYDGESWQRLQDVSTSRLTGIWGTTAEDVFVSGLQGVFHFNGIDWQTVTTGSFNAIWGSETAGVFAVGSSGKIRHFDGLTWETMDSPSDTSWTGVWGASAEDIFIVGWSGNVAHFDGEYWTLLDSGYNDHLWGVWGSGSSDVYAVGSGGVILRWDGAEWTQEVVGQVTGLRGGLSPFEGCSIAVGYYNTILERGSCIAIFSDGFESGDVGGWSSPSP